MNFREEINKILQKHPDLTILAVTKNQSAQTILNLPNSISHIGENKVQEAEQKFEELSSKSNRKFTKHFIGNLQSNKINKAIQIFDYIQSVHNLILAQKINEKSQKLNIITKIFLQINISKDPQKQGFEADLEIIKNTINTIKEYKNIELVGLMTILENTNNDLAIRNSYLQMQNLFKYVNKHILKLKYLSMGMSDDYNQALENGSNIIRIGRKLFQ